MSGYVLGNYPITARSGRVYLVTYSGRMLNSSVFPPRMWSPPTSTRGLSWYPSSGCSLGGGTARWVDLKARWAIARMERTIRRNDRAWRFIDRKLRGSES